jgi:hypothetical protein
LLVDMDPKLRPQVRHPKITRRRTLVLDRVTLQPAPPSKRHPTARHQWRIVQGAAAAAIMVSVPLAHASERDEPLRDFPLRDALAEVIPAPEPLEHEPLLWVAQRTPPPAYEAPHKLEGIKANPYEEEARPTRPRATRPRLVRKTMRAEKPAVYEPVKMTDLKSNPYD